MAGRRVTTLLRVDAARRITAAVAALMVAAAVHAAGQFIEDIQVSRRGDEATVTLELACPMRFQSDMPTQEGVLLEIRVSPLDSCRQIASDGIASEVYRPVGGQLAHLQEVEYESLGLGDNLVVLHFDRPVAYRVAQRGDLRSLQLIVRLEGSPDGVRSTPAPPPRPSTAQPAPPQPAAGRAPLGVRVREPATVPDYVVNLESTRDAVDPRALDSVSWPPGSKPYVSVIDVAQDRWYRLRLGFFTNEAAARAALGALGDKYPRAWIGRAEAEEVRQAADASFPIGGQTSVAAAQAPRSSDVALDSQAASGATAAGGALTPERLLELRAQGREALLANDYEAAIRIYTRLVQEPGDQRAEAREYLGLARERNGQIAHASAEYRAYLQEYPTGEGARRVQQRLNGLIAAAEAPRPTLRGETTANRSPWQMTTGITQYYRRDLNQFDETLPEVVTLSAVFTDLDMGMRRTGGRLNWLARLSVSNMYDLDPPDTTTSGFFTGSALKPTRISYAYFDADDPASRWALRVGRQSLHDWGVLGRFDGAHFSYDWASERRVHFVTGFPVESTRNGIETWRQFYGAAVDFDHLIGSWDFSAFLNMQTIEGIDDRRAVGAEVRYLDDKRSLTSMLDYDVDYGRLNMALVLGTWRFENRLTLTALVDERTSPILTTRNALIGQPVTTIDELLLVLDENAIRQLALDRTASSGTVTLGLSKPLSERFQVNADVTATEIDGTVESFGVPAVPDTGQQVYYSASFIGAGLFGGGDVSIFNLRRGVAPDFTTSQVTWDARFPASHRLRLNPRVRFALWESPDGRRRQSVGPSFRLLWNTPKRYRIEAEIGSDEFLRTDLTNVAARQKATGNYVNVGYRADF